MYLYPTIRSTHVLAAVATALLLFGCGEKVSSLSTEAAAKQKHEAGQVFQDCAHCPQMVVVPAGSFFMGSTRAEQDWSVEHGRPREYTDRENPRHEVTFDRSFAVGVHEVTRGQYSAFVKESSHPMDDRCETFEETDGKYTRLERTGRNWRNPGFSQTDSHPVVCLTWDDTVAYTKWLSTKTGAHYRLLSEAEWEYIARAGTETYRFWGNDKSNIAGCEYANVADNTPSPNGQEWPRKFDCSDGYWMTSPVGSFRANGFGVYDAIGNVWEWVEDCANDTYIGAPTDGSAWTKSGNCANRVLRGGALHEGGGFTRSAVRGNYSREGRISTDGFRLARDLH